MKAGEIVILKFITKKYNIKNKFISLYTYSNMDEICADMNLLKVDEPKYDENTTKLKEDLDTFMREIVKAGTYDLDVYDLCVSCGHDLTWDIQYIIREIDIEWLKTDGLVYFIHTMNIYMPINNNEIYKQALVLYYKLLELFTLSVE